jgi:hypothetical protein
MSHILSHSRQLEDSNNSRTHVHRRGALLSKAYLKPPYIDKYLLHASVGVLAVPSTQWIFFVVWARDAPK